jgi:hypothetical protein
MRKKKNNNEEPQKYEGGPTDDFCEWWNPTGTDALSGASIGGHPDAERVWARPESHGRFARRHYGITAALAWTCAAYRDEYREWVRLGRPERNPFVSMAATTKKQGEFWHSVAGMLPRVGKRMPATEVEDNDDPIPF